MVSAAFVQTGRQFSTSMSGASKPGRDSRLSAGWDSLVALHAQRGRLAMAAVSRDRSPQCLHAGSRGEVCCGAQTEFEIGSVTKVFTNLLLLVGDAHGWCRREMCAAEIVLGRKRPATLPLDDLAAHLGGLPEWPSNLEVGPSEQPFCHYRASLLEEALVEDTKTHRVAGGYRYSTYGTAVLGAALARTADSSYPEACRRHVLTPLGLEGRFGLEQKDYSPAGQPAGETFFGCFAPAGGLLLKTGDAVSFISACLDPDRTPLAGALRAAEAIRAPLGPGWAVAQAWHVKEAASGAIYWHNGRTPQGRSFFGYCPARGLGVAIMSDFDQDWDAAGFGHLLGKPPLI
jgi:CubicO group peptidase (beta-lactamase class C family)